jgi:hypothetical protein
MRKILPIGLLVVGLLLFAVALAQGIGGVASSLRTIGQPWTAPQTSSQQLSAGDYVVYEQSRFPSLAPEDITVTGPAGPVAVAGTMSSTLTLGNTTYVGIGSFTADRDGTYDIEVIGDGQTVVLGPSLGRTLGGAFAWIAAGIVGVVIAIAGAVWLVVSLVVGRRKPESNPTVQGSWYPDPEDPAQYRWWDGRQWTEERRPR